MPADPTVPVVGVVTIVTVIVVAAAGSDLRPRGSVGQLAAALPSTLEKRGGIALPGAADRLEAAFVGVDDEAAAAGQALDAALALRDLAAGLRTARLHIGVATGPLALRCRSRDPTAGWTLSGATRELASRLATALGGGAVVASMGTYELVRKDFEGYATVPLWWDNAGRPSHVSVVTNRKPVTSWRHLLSDDPTPLVGRTAELSTLKSAYAEVRSSRRELVIDLVAEPGMGKSKLIEAFAADATRTPAPTVVVRASGPCYGGEPFHAIHELLDELLPTPRLPVPDTIPMLARALTTAIRATARRATVVMLIDDLHWVDATTCEALVHVFDNCVSEPVLVVRAYRPSFRGAAKDSVASRTEIRLGPLEPGDSIRLLRARYPHLSAEQRAEILEEAAGSPLFLQEAGAMADNGATREAGRVVAARSVEELMLQRVHAFASEQLTRLERLGHLPGATKSAASEIDAVERHIDDWLDRIEAGGYVQRGSAITALRELRTLDFNLRIVRWRLGLTTSSRGRLRDTLERLSMGSTGKWCDAIDSLARNEDRHTATSAALDLADNAMRNDDLDGVVTFNRAALTHWPSDTVEIRHRTTREVGVALGDALEALGYVNDAATALATAVDSRRNADSPRTTELLLRCARLVLRTGDVEEARVFLRRAQRSRAPNDDDVAGAATRALIHAYADPANAVGRLLHAIERAFEAGRGDLVLDIACVLLVASLKADLSTAWETALQYALESLAGRATEPDLVRLLFALARAPTGRTSSDLDVLVAWYTRSAERIARSRRLHGFLSESPAAKNER